MSTGEQDATAIEPIVMNIVQKEILPKVAKDPDYLDKQNMEADEKGNYRQRPARATRWGENGALKKVPDVYSIDRRHSAAVTGP